MLKREGLWWVDENGNRWSRKRKPRPEELLVNCTDCVNCYGCKDCNNCHDCTNCYNCTDCVNCTNCYSCLGCTGCTNGKSCTDCKDCTDCEWCNNCIECVRCRATIKIPVKVFRQKPPKITNEPAQLFSSCRNCTDCEDCKVNNKRRYSAWHYTEHGFETQLEVERWIAEQSNPEEWRVAASEDVFVDRRDIEESMLDEREQKVQRRIRKAVEDERQRIIHNIIGDKL